VAWGSARNTKYYVHHHCVSESGVIIILSILVYLFIIPIVREHRGWSLNEMYSSSGHHFNHFLLGRCGTHHTHKKPGVVTAYQI